MMLGETVVLGVGGGGSGNLLRPRSADNLARLAPASSMPALDDLTESEVFVGEEEEETVLVSNGNEKNEDFRERPKSLQEILAPFDQVSPCDGTTPDLHSPTSPTPIPTTNLVITYHDESLRLPLDAVKEEVEAEALEEASMILSSGPGSLSHTSLASSVISNTSLDDATLSSRTDTLDTVIAVNIIRQTPSPESTTSSSPMPAKTSPPPRPGNRDAARVSGTTPPRTSPTSPRSSGRSSPRTSTDTPRTPERRRKTVSVSSPRSDSSRGSTPRTPALRTTPRTSEKPKSEEKKIPRSSLRSSTISTERKSSSRLHDTARKDAEKSSSHLRTKLTDKDHTDESRSTSLLRKKKVETKDTKTEADKSGTLGRKKKEPKSEKEEVAEKYGTLGRCRKAKESGDAKDDGRDHGISKDTKHTLDMYATLPRRKAREMSARWREQMASEEEAAKVSLRRTKSIGKTESSSSSSSSRGRSTNSVMTSSLPSSALTGLSRARSPRSTHREPRPVPGSSSSTTRKERTIICLETAVQTSLTGNDVSSAMRALSRQNSSNNDDGSQYTKPHVTFISEVEPPKERKDRQHVEVQVELAWRLGEGELPEHVRRLTEEHTRLQTEHARARARLEEMEKLQSEVESLRMSLQEEKMEKEEVQGELDRTSQRVKEMLASMEGVEHEFNSRGDSLIELESQLHHSANVHIQMQEKLNQYEEFAVKIKRDLDKSVAAQKTLLQQVQDLENEGREISDFMAEEKNALAECLREAETELARLRDECKQLSAKYKQKDEEARHMVRLAEERKNKCMALQAEICSIQSRTRDMMVCQGAEVSGAAVSLANLSSRLQTLIDKLVQDYSITESDLEMIVTPTESDSSASSTNGTPERKSPYKVSARTPSPRKTASFISALLHAMRGSPKEKMNQLGGTSHCNGTSKQITEGRNSPEGSESIDLEPEGVKSTLGSPPSASNSVSLADQVTEVDILLTRFLKVCCVLKNDTDNRLGEIEDENDRLCSQIRSQQVIIDQQHSDYENLSRSEARAKRELMVVSRDLDLTTQKLNKYYQEDYELQVKPVWVDKLEEEVERLGTTVRHLEALNTEKEQQLATSLASLSAAQGPVPPNHVSLAVHQQEIGTLNDKVTSLRQSVIERDRRISELSERHSEDLASIREAQLEAQKCNRRMASTVEHVLKPVGSHWKSVPKTFRKVSIRPYNPRVPRLWKMSPILSPEIQPLNSCLPPWQPLKSQPCSRMEMPSIRMSTIKT
ncbi:rootletin-like isoform X2 [Macrobrachium nipponense]|uniref:rootletin-like isoform X2 n=1 Tax=Macrobrachium nipponense TaxID=159736 RepID=UPI0030C8475A